MNYCPNTYINEIEIVFEDNDFIHIKSFGCNYIISKTKNFEKLINKSKELQKLSTAYLITPQEKCSTNYLIRIIIQELGLEYDGELEYETRNAPVLKVIDNASVSYFYYKK